MALVSVRINGRDYNLACGEGQEEQLVALGQEVDDRVRQIAKQAPHAGEVMLFLLTAIMLTDELADTRRLARQAGARVTRLEERLAGEGLMGADELEEARAQERHSQAQREAILAETLKEAARRIETIAARLELE